MVRSICLSARFAIFVALSVCLLVPTCFAIALDGTFGSGGKFTTSFADNGSPSASASRVFVQPSGRIVVIGWHQAQGVQGRVNGIAMAGLTTAGVLDDTFGSDGKVLIWMSNGNIQLTDAKMLGDGSFVLLYQFTQAPNTPIPVLVKYTANGQPDGTFSADPRVSPTPTTQSIILALGNQGKIYALVAQETENFLLRFNADGSRDETFAANGLKLLSLKRIPTFQRAISGLHELDGGKILVTGHYDEMDTGYGNGFAVRFDSSANIDRSFGRQGVFHIEIPWGSVGFTSSLVQPDGKVLLAGYYTFLGSNALIVRLTTRGRYDGTFGSAGISMSSLHNINVIYGMVIGPDDKIFVAGTISAKSAPAKPEALRGAILCGGYSRRFSDN